MYEHQINDLQKIIKTAPFLSILLEIETPGVKADMKLPLYFFWAEVHPEWELRRN